MCSIRDNWRSRGQFSPEPPHARASEGVCGCAAPCLGPPSGQPQRGTVFAVIHGCSSRAAWFGPYDPRG